MVMPIGLDGHGFTIRGGYDAMDFFDCNCYFGMPSKAPASPALSDDRGPGAATRSRGNRRGAGVAHRPA